MMIHYSQSVLPEPNILYQLLILRNHSVNFLTSYSCVKSVTRLFISVSAMFG